MTDLTVPAAALVNVCPESGEVSFNHCGDRREMRTRIVALKDRLLAATGEHREMPVEHILNDGTYTRKLLIPKGTFLVGKVHRKDCVNIVAAGDISLLTEFGTRRVQAGFTAISRAGIMKVGYAHEDTVFINVFRTDETDIARIEASIACEDPELVPIDEIQEIELCL